MNKKAKNIAIWAPIGVLGAAAVAGVATLTAVAVKTNNGVGTTDIFKPLEPNNKIESPISTQVSAKTKLEIKKVTTPGTRAQEEKYELTLINDDTKGEVKFVNKDGSLVEGNKIIVERGQKVNVKVNIKPEFANDYTIVNFEVFDESNPNYSLGVTKVDENNYHFTMPMDEKNTFYTSGVLSAKITYGLKKLGAWEYDFDTKRYVFEVTEDDFVYDDVKNPELAIQDYPETGAFVVYEFRLNGHNVIIKNMTIAKNTQMEFVNKGYWEQTTNSSPILALAKDGQVTHRGAAGLWRGVRLTSRAMSAFGFSDWGQDSNVLIVPEETIIK